MSDDVEDVDQPDDGSVTSRRLSRRTMIAGTAGAAAAMWAAPAVTSLGSRAFATSPVCSSGYNCTGLPTPCAYTNGVPTCFCATSKEETPVCVGVQLNLRSAPTSFVAQCTSSANCGDGKSCVKLCQTFLGNTYTFYTCAPVCG